MPFACPANTLIEYLDFRATAASNANFEFVERKVQEQSYADQVAGVNWNTITPAIGYYDASGREALDGDVYHRRCQENPDPAGDPLPLEEWSYYCRTTEMEGRLHRVNPNREQVNTPGSNMKNPVGIVLQDENDDPIVTPGSGEQARHEWTGALLFDDDGNAILVP